MMPPQWQFMHQMQSSDSRSCPKARESFSLLPWDCHPHVILISLYYIQKHLLTYWTKCRKESSQQRPFSVGGSRPTHKPARDWPKNKRWGTLLDIPATQSLHNNRLHLHILFVAAFDNVEGSWKGSESIRTTEECCGFSCKGIGEDESHKECSGSRIECSLEVGIYHVRINLGNKQATIFEALWSYLSDNQGWEVGGS